MRVLLVAPGPKHSTYDVFAYYLESMRNNGVHVVPFSYHNVLQWHYDSLLYHVKGIPEEDAQGVAISRAARELLVNVITEQPSVVHFVAGGMIPEFVWIYLVDLRNKLKKPFIISLHLTESPYQDAIQSTYAKYADVLFVNDKYSLNYYDKNSDKHVYYLPHSYNPSVHHPFYEVDEDYRSDVFFVATPFRERGEFLAKVNWDGIDFKLGGPWSQYTDPTDYLKIKKHIFTSEPIDNKVMARYYNGAKISLNVHRRKMFIDGLDDGIDNKNDAYSAGPRVFEAIACGSFLLTDYRREVEDLLGDSVVFFETPSDLEKSIRFYLSEDSARIEKTEEAMEKIKHCTFDNRLKNILLPIWDELIYTYF